MNIVIVGGGAGGLELACRLGRRYRRQDDINITLVDRAPAHLWKPLLHEVAAGTLDADGDEMSYLAQAHWHHFRFRRGALGGLDRAARTVDIEATRDPEGEIYIPAATLPYDVLVLAVGSISNDFAIPGVAEHCFFLDSREQADRFNEHLLRACYRANAGTEPVPGALHIAIAGAGATGVELAAELHFAIRALVAFGLDNIDVERDLRIHLVEASARILPGLPQRVSDNTLAALESMGIEVHTGAAIERASADGFGLADGTTIDAAIRVWAAGIKGPDLLQDLDGLAVNRAGQLRVSPGLKCENDAHIYAIGDCASLLQEDGTPVPPRAQAAHQQADFVCDAIARELSNRPPREYHYRDFGSLISISQHSAVGNLMGNLLGRHHASFPLEGRLARWAYLSLYKMHQVAVHGWFRTSMITIADLFTRAGKPRLKLH